MARKKPFHGRVIPNKKVPACRIRHIRVLVQSPSANNVVARTTSDAHGRYHVAYSPHKNSYTVVANRKELKNGFVCRRGESHPINFQK